MVSDRSQSDASPAQAGEVAPRGAAAWLAPAGWGLLLVMLVFVAYQPAWRGEFLWDDDAHLLSNPVLQPGGLATVWKPGGYLNYWPLTYTVYWVQFKLWGLNPLGFHLVNIGLHALIAWGIWRVLVLLRLPGALLAAALFALHPVNVESVAWISQLKGILSLLLTVLTVWLYVADEQRGGRWRYGATVMVFGLATLAKGAAVTLPVVLLLLAWWQRGRIAGRDVIRVMPFAVIGAVMTGVEIWMQQSVAGPEVVRADSLFSRAAIAGCAVWFYLAKVLWPANLCFVYPQWVVDERAVASYLPGVALVALVGVAWWQRARWGRGVFMTMACYTVLLLPALGFVNIYFMRYSWVADHYQYAAMIVPCAAAAAVGARWGCRLGAPGRRLGAGGLLLVLGVLTWRQARMYQDEFTLWRDTLAKNPAGWMAHLNLGNLLQKTGRPVAAVKQYRQALQLQPANAEIHSNLAVALARAGQLPAALAHLDRAVELRPDSAEIHYTCGQLLAQMGRTAAAVQHYEHALQLNPQHAEAHSNLGTLLLAGGKVAEALAHFEQAARLKPAVAAMHYNLGLALAQADRMPEALSQYERAVQLRPELIAARNQLATGWLQAGRLTDALHQFEQVVRLEPESADAHNNLAAVLLKCGRVPLAIEHYREAVRLRPAYGDAHYGLGVALTAAGEHHAAIQHFEQAVRLEPGDALAHYKLGLLLHQLGRTTEANEHIAQARRLRPDLPGGPPPSVAVDD